MRLYILPVVVLLLVCEAYAQQWGRPVAGPTDETVKNINMDYLRQVMASMKAQGAKGPVQITRPQERQAPPKSQGPQQRQRLVILPQAQHRHVPQASQHRQRPPSRPKATSLRSHTDPIFTSQHSPQNYWGNNAAYQPQYNHQYTPYSPNVRYHDYSRYGRNRRNNQPRRRRRFTFRDWINANRLLNPEFDLSELFSA